MKKIKVGVVGYGFGRLFARMFQLHPAVEFVGICEKNPELVKLAETDGFHTFHEEYHDMLKDDFYDAIYLGLPIEFHAVPTIEVLNAGKHCACAVPAAFTIDELYKIVEAERKSGKNYMMMETNVYVKRFLYVKELYETGRLGRIQYMRGIHSQSMENWPGAWVGLPPMWYATHAVAPLLALVRSRATRVTCHGSGDMSEQYTQVHGNPFPVETMTFTLENNKAVAEVTRTLFETAPYGGENFEIFGSKATFSAITGELTVMSDKPCDWGRGLETQTGTPNFSARWNLVPEGFGDTTGHADAAAQLVHEFVGSIVEGRKSAIDAVTAANWCAVGICGHESAMAGGKPVAVPSFE